MDDYLKTIWEEAFVAFFTIGLLSVHSHGGTKESNGKLCPVPRAIFDPGTSRLQECKLEPTCLDPL